MTDTLIRNAIVLTQDSDLGELRAGEVLVSGDRIAAVGESVEAPPDVDVIDAAGGIVLPGFVDTHRHMWSGALRGSGHHLDLPGYFAELLERAGPRLTPADLGVGELLSARASLDAGITTVQDTSDINDSPERTDAIVAALRSSGLRVVFAYEGSWQWVLEHGVSMPADVRRVRGVLADDDALVTMALETRHGADDAERYNASLAGELGLRTVRHVRAGMAPGRLRDLGALVPGTTFVHANELAADEFAVMADSGGAVSVSPVLELSMRLGRPVFAAALAAGLPISLSIDTEVAGPSDMFTAMRLAYLQARFEHLPVSAGDVLRWATLGGAQALGLADRIGSITPGKQADLVVLRTDRPGAGPIGDPAAAVVMQLDRSHVDTVLVAGVAHKRDGRLLVDSADLLAAATEVGQRMRA